MHLPHWNVDQITLNLTAVTTLIQLLISGYKAYRKNIGK